MKIKNILIGLLIGLAISCANLATQMFRTEQAAVNLAYATYIGYTNGLYSGAIKVTPDGSNSIKSARLRLAASISVAEGWRAVFETNSAVESQYVAALNTTVDTSSNLVFLIHLLTQ